MRGKTKKRVSGESQRFAELESVIRKLGRVFERNGVEVRREKLCSGPAFKVKSGNCLFSGKNLIFVDKRLPVDQQLNVLYDHLAEVDVLVSPEELEELPQRAQELIAERPLS